MPPSVGRVRISRACGYSPAHSAHPWYTTLRGGRSSWVWEYPDPVGLRQRDASSWRLPSKQGHTQATCPREDRYYIPPGRAVRGSPIAMKRHGNRMALVTKIQKSLPPARPAPLTSHGGPTGGAFELIKGTTTHLLRSANHLDRLRLRGSMLGVNRTTLDRFP